MSFVRLDNGEFPPLDRSIESSSSAASKKKSKAKNRLFLNHHEFNGGEQSRPSKDEEVIVSGNDFVACRTGLYLRDSELDLQGVLDTTQIGQQCGDFIVVPIQPKRSQCYTNTDLDALPDLILPSEVWHSRVAIEVCYPKMSQYNLKAAQTFENLIRHALYLPASVIIVSCPNNDIIHISAISSINNRLEETQKDFCHPLILFKVPSPLQLEYTSEAEAWQTSSCNSKLGEEQDSSQSTANISQISTQSTETTSCSSQEPFENLVTTTNSIVGTSWTTDSGYQLNFSRESKSSTSVCPWQQWNAIRSHINPDRRIGVCLEVNDEFFDNDQELERWMGEPVRLVILHTDQFTRAPGHNALRLSPKCKRFLTNVALANSLKTGFVVEGVQNTEVRDYMQYLEDFANSLRTNYLDPLRDWDDRIQPPLQPLSMNLDSGTYGVFEMDKLKYSGYKEAMIVALNHLITEDKRSSRKFVLMILGAGRGPLVDAMIEAVTEVNTTECKFSIYALDKNPSSVKALRYKKKFEWDAAKRKDYTTEVIEHDMRTWEPGVSADIIASELLGSLADNELSPECLDGVWRFSTPKTISIPQEYSSYIAPICSYKMHQELYKLHNVDTHPYDQIYVVRLRNCYHIDATQRLFQFQHHDLSLSPDKRCNSRYARLVFCSKIDTVCHGFAGYFSAKLFNEVFLSTVIDKNKTQNMESWFPAFIPLEHPIPMPKGALLEVHFWRKESSSTVWYEWVVVRPVRTRLYGQNGVKTAMSKFI